MIQFDNTFCKLNKTMPFELEIIIILLVLDMQLQYHL